MNNFGTAHKEKKNSGDVIEQLQKHLAQPEADYPEDLIKQIIEQRDYATPKLLAMLENFLTNLPRDIDGSQWIEGIVALFILAKLREQKVFPYVVRLCSIPHKAVEPLLGDVADYVAEFLASTFNGDWKALHSLVTNQHLDEYMRGAVLDAYVILYKNKVMSREDILKVFSDLFNELKNDFSLVPSMLISNCCDIHATELSDQINKYFDNDIVELSFISRDDVKDVFSLPQKIALETLFNSSAYNFIGNLKDSMGWLFENDEDCDGHDHH